MVYGIERGEGVDHDLDLIFDFLLEAAQDFGEDEQDAWRLAEFRLVEIERSMRSLGGVPHQGTLRPHLGTQIRSVTKGRAVLYFDVDDVRRRVRVLAVFFGGQDHEARILLRLLNRT